MLWGFVENNMSSDMFADKDVVVSLVQRCGYFLGKADPALRADSDVVAAAVNNTFGCGLEFVLGPLKHDEHFLMATCSRYGLALEFVPSEFATKNLVLAAVRSAGAALRFAPRELRNDKEVVLEAVRADGTSLQYASQDLQGDRSVVLEAVIKSGLALEFASVSLRSDFNVVALAVLSHDGAGQFASAPVQRFVSCMNHVRLIRPFWHWWEYQ